jgi:RNA polymerase sigma-70 factor (ECF subfamily)
LIAARSFQLAADSLTVQPDTTAARPDEQFIQLFTRYQRPLYLFILSQLGNVQDAEEVLQNTNIVLLTKQEQFQAGTNFFAWACQVARYEVLQFRQSIHRDRLRFSDDFIDTVAGEPALSADIQDRRRLALDACIKKLRPEDQELIRQRYQPGAHGKDLALDLDRPANSVYQSLGRIRRTLLECINRTLASDKLA